MQDSILEMTFLTLAGCDQSAMFSDCVCTLL